MGEKIQSASEYSDKDQGAWTTTTTTTSTITITNTTTTSTTTSITTTTRVLQLQQKSLEGYTFELFIKGNQTALTVVGLPAQRNGKKLLYLAF